MIKFEDGRLQLSGSSAQLCMEFSLVTKAIRESVTEKTSEEYAERKIESAFEDSRLPDEEIMMKYFEGKRESEKGFAELLMEILSGKGV